MDAAELEGDPFPAEPGSPGRRKYKPIGEKEILHKIDILLPRRVRPFDITLWHAWHVIQA